MALQSRRGFLADVGSGMLAVGLGTALLDDLGCSTAFAAEGTQSIPLGPHAQLVDLMRQTPAERLQPLLAKMVLRGEATLPQLVAAGALANAVTFGGCDYVGFHTAMALLPALEMSGRLPVSRSPLPVLKVLYRNGQQMQAVGGASITALHALEHGDPIQQPTTATIADQLRVACRNQDVELGEKLLASVGEEPDAGLNALQPAIQDDLDVHRYVFAYRTYGLANLLGAAYSQTLLRQCVRFCVREEKQLRERQIPEAPIRQLVPRLLDQYRLVGRTLGGRDPGDAAVLALSEVIYRGPSERSADAVAAALADGIGPEFVGEAISLAANQYVLRQPADGKRTHGDSAGVHASDATNAWRNMARRAEPRHAVSGLIVAAYHVGVQSPPFQTPEIPTSEQKDLIQITDPSKLLAEAEDAIRHNDQVRAAAAVQIYGEQGHDVERVLSLLLDFAVSEDGRLHGEKYYHTVCDEFRSIRPAFRWREVTALARVTASSFGYNREDKHGFRAAGYEEACQLLGVES